MSNPTDPTPPQPSEAYPPAAPLPADAQPTAAYPPAHFQPTEAYPPAGSPVYGQPAPEPAPYAQPGYGQAGYGDPAYGQAPGGAPTAPDTRPRTLGWIALGLAIAGLVLVGVAFVPLLWVSLGLALVGGLLLLIALVLGIVTLASKKQGGKGLGIGAIAVSVLGGLAWMGAVTLAFVLIGFAAVDSSSSTVEPAPSATAEVVPDDEAAEEDGAQEPTGVYDEPAYLAQVRPEITALMQELDPSITEEMLGQIYSDEMLVTTGKALLVAGDAAKAAFVASTVEASGGVFTEEQAIRFYDSIVDAAGQYLVE